MACRSLDDQVAVPKDAELRKLLDRFVCVRQVQMWGVDLKRFQFDYSMTWAIFLMNGKGTIYGRYGSRSAVAKGSAREISLAGFKQALEGALALHVRYLKDPESVLPEVAGKQPQVSPAWSRTELIPALKARAGLAQAFRPGLHGRHGSCIHCHMVPNHEILSLREAGQAIPDRKFWPYPMPDVIGMHMDPEQRAQVLHVRSASPAAAAGLQPGDRIRRFAGQTILSTADLQWVLENASDRDTLKLELVREGALKNLTLVLASGWRRHGREWRFINLGVMNSLVGFNGRPLKPEESRRWGVSADKLAWRVGRIMRRRLGRVDLRRGDLIVEMDGRRAVMNLGELTRYLTVDKRSGSTLHLVRQRHGKERSIELRVH